MDDLVLVIGNKNYSSWSLRPWLALKQAGLPFREVVIPLYQADSAEALAKHSYSKRVPALTHGATTTWDSLAICEYVAELAPDARLWPADRAARAFARSMCAEMHSGFAALRTHMPMNIRGRKPGVGRTADSLRDIDRIRTLWTDAIERFGRQGPFLFGHFTIADAMFAPVVTRFRTYEVELDARLTAYGDAVWTLPAMQEWRAAGAAETWTIPASEYPPIRA